MSMSKHFKVFISGCVVYATVAACSASGTTIFNNGSGGSADVAVASTSVAASGSASSGSGEWYDFDGGPIVDAMVEPVPDASAGPGSGTRLKMKTFLGADGSVVHAGIWDDQLKLDCSVYPASDGSLRCIPSGPAASGTAFADPSCTTELVYTYGSCQPKAALRYDAMINGCYPFPFEVKAYSVGAKMTPQFVFTGNAASCVKSAPIPGYSYYELGQEMPPAMFVLMSISVEP